MSSSRASTIWRKPRKPLREDRCARTDRVHHPESEDGPGDVRRRVTVTVPAMQPVAEGHQAPRPGPAVRRRHAVAPVVGRRAVRHAGPRCARARARIASAGTRRYHHVATYRRSVPNALRRHVARRPPRPPGRHRPRRGRPARHRRRGPLPVPGCGRPCLDGGVHDRRPDGRGRALDRLGGEPGPWCPLREHPGAVHGAGARRGLGVHGPGAQHPCRDVRHGSLVLRDGCARGRRSADLRARPQRADVHVPAADGLRDVDPRRRHRGGLVAARSSSRATTTSSTRRSTPRTRSP